MKRVLSATGDPLVDAVLNVFARTPLSARRIEQFREDLTLVDSNGGAVAIVEVKGVNGGVTREQVNQADSHRERSGYQPDFPALLIVNTGMKKSKSIEDKNIAVANEQAQHAVKLNVLILRTLDLLNLVNLLLSGKLDEAQFASLLIENRGWLEVSATEWVVRTGAGA